MTEDRSGQIAVLFVSTRTGEDEAGYAAASEAMGALAAAQPGYRGVTSARGADGVGITISYWADEAAAIAWRNHPDHIRIRDLGRGRWYCDYEAIVTEVRRSYRWPKP